MGSALHAENKVPVDPHALISPLPLKSSYFNPFSPFTGAYDRFARWRADLGLPHPGTVENLQKEVKGPCSIRHREGITLTCCTLSYSPV